MSRPLFLFLLICTLLLQFSGASAQADKQLVEMADMTYAYGARQDALDQYLLALKSNPVNDRAAYMAGRIYLQSADKSKALKYLLKAQELNPKRYSDIYLLIGMAHHSREEFGEAIRFYEKFKSDVNNATYLDPAQKAPILTELTRLMDMAKKAGELKGDRRNIEITVLGENINSENPDYAPALTSDGKTMIFTSRRRGGVSGNKDVDNLFFEDIYISYFVDSAWTPARNIGAPVNTSYHDASIGMSPDGKTLFLYRDVRKGDIFSSTWLNDSTWGEPETMGRIINSSYKETSVTMTEDGSKMFFTSNRPGGQGGFDIYVSTASKNGKWKKPKSLGSTINSPYDEESPFITPDGKTLYFSSTGHSGIGGFDIFRSDFDEGTETWSIPENLGYPINSVYDDVFFTRQGDLGYFASVRDDGLGEQDIIVADFNPDTLVSENETDTAGVPMNETDTAIVSESTESSLHDVNLVVKVYDEKKNPLAANVELATEKGSTIKLQSVEKGVFQTTFTLVDTGIMRLSIEHDGYMFYNSDLELPRSINKDKKLTKEIYLKPMRTGMVSVLHNIYFDFDKAVLKPTSYPELEKVVKVLKDNPKVTVIVSGHTDEMGDKAYNASLSLQRAQAVVNYLIKAGIESSRMEPKGFGATKPLVSNDDEKDGRELNRRTELIVVKDGSTAK